MGIGHRIASLRNNRQPRLTQEEFAKKIGISRAALSHYEKDRRDPDYETLKKVADFFEVSIDYLLGRVDDPKPVNGDSQTTKKLTPYQQTVLDWVTSREDFSFYESPEDLIDMIEQFEIMYERLRKKE